MICLLLGTNLFSITTGVPVDYFILFGCLTECKHKSNACFMTHISCMQGFVDRFAVIAAAGSTGYEPGTFVRAFDKAAADKQRIVLVGHSLG